MALTDKLSNIGDAIRRKTGGSDLLTLDEMVTEIDAIESGGGELPEEALLITGDCTYKFAYNGWNWFIEEYGNKITTENLTSCQYMFYEATDLTEIPFDINVANSTDLNSCFKNCKNLESLPLIKGNLLPQTSSSKNILNMSNLFSYCYKVKSIPYDYFYNFADSETWTSYSNYESPRGNVFNNCECLRELPDISMMKTKGTSYIRSFYYYAFQDCHSLDEITNLIVNTESTYTSNAFNSMVAYCNRLKDMTFEMQNDSPYVATWKNQTIDLSNYVGYSNAYLTMVNLDNGFTVDNQVKDATTYEALKDNPDYWTWDINYSRYNHDSAVRTINSLPDVSSGSGNTIKFKGAAGALTDGGAINTLTEEEIAVATAKGWTVTLV